MPKATAHTFKPRAPSKRFQKLLDQPPKLPPGDISKRNRAMVSLFPWTLCLLRELPRSYRDAIAVHLKGKRPSDKDLILALGHKLVGVAKLPLAVLCNQVMNDPDRRSDFRSMDEYSRFFCRKDIEGDRVHPWKSVWPIVLSGRGRERETIIDGWHRFHSYYRRFKRDGKRDGKRDDKRDGKRASESQSETPTVGVRSIPVIWYADE